MQDMLQFRACLVLVVVVAAGCRSAAPMAPPVAPANRPQPAPVPTATEPDGIRWVRTSAEYKAATLQAYRVATAFIEAESRGKAAGSWAVILDADETIISNVTYQLERAKQGLGYSPESWGMWVRRREATPVAGAAGFLARVRALGGRIAVVTNRLQSECADTIAVFEKYSLVYDAMLCRQDGTPSDKNPRFESVARGQTPAGSSPLEVVAWVGDNILDFPRLSQTSVASNEASLAPFGGRYILVPNPMYGSWQ
jgi:5'-nucleotidase (lipoprotein e(P4) family)